MWKRKCAAALLGRLALVVCLSGMVAGCAVRSTPHLMAGAYESAATPNVILGRELMATPADAPTVLPAAAAENRPVELTTRFVIYNARLRIVVVDVAQALQDAQAVAARLGGYMQTIRGDAIVIRVPADQFESALETLIKYGAVIEQEIDALDVTEEYVDLEARLRTAQATAKRLEALLEKAASVQDTVTIEKELARVNTEIKQLIGKLNVFKSRIAFSTITVYFERIARQIPSVQNFRQLPFVWLRSLDPAQLWE